MIYYYCSPVLIPNNALCCLESHQCNLVCDLFYFPSLETLVISIMRRHSNRRNRPKSFDPRAMSFQDLQALPKKSLLLLASARNLVTTGTKAQLAQRIVEHDNNSLPRQPAATVDQANIPLQPQNVADVEETNTSQTFTSGQLDQLRVLIAEAVSHESHRPAGENTAELLSPVSVSSLPGAQNGLQQDGVLPSGNPLGTRPLEVNTVMPGLLPSSLLPVACPQSNPSDPHMPPLPQKLKNKILKREYVDFTDLLSSNMYPVHTSSSSDNFTLAINPEDTSTLSFVPSQQKKSRINGLSSWLEAWNLYFRTLLSGFPHLAPDLLAYQDQICKFSRKFKSSAWLMYDTAFRHMAASNLSTSWSKINEQLYNDILKEETLPFCITCHSYGHRTVACPSRSKSTQPFRPSAGGPFGNASSTPTMPDPVKSSASTANPPLQAFQPQPNARRSICRDFNRRLCRRPNCQFQHICNKPECGGNHPGFQCPKSV